MHQVLSLVEAPFLFDLLADMKSMKEYLINTHKQN